MSWIQVKFDLFLCRGSWSNHCSVVCLAACEQRNASVALLQVGSSELVAVNSPRTSPHAHTFVQSEGSRTWLCVQRSRGSATLPRLCHELKVRTQLLFLLHLWLGLGRVKQCSAGEGWGFHAASYQTGGFCRGSVAGINVPLKQKCMTASGPVTLVYFPGKSCCESLRVCNFALQRAYKKSFALQALFFTGYDFVYMKM